MNENIMATLIEKVCPDYPKAFLKKKNFSEIKQKAKKKTWHSSKW